MSLGVEGITTSSSSTTSSTARTCAEPVTQAFHQHRMESELKRRTRQDPDSEDRGSQKTGHHEENASHQAITADVSRQQNQNVLHSQNVGFQPFDESARESSNQQIDTEEVTRTSQIRRWALRIHKKYARYMNSRARPGDAYVPTVEEHIANMCTHGVLVLPSIVAIFWMLHLASDNLQHFIAIIYGIALVVLFGVSTIFHVLSYCGQSTNLRNLFHIGDRAVIYIFIAASYTPWLTLKEYDGWGSSMLWIVWIAAMLGIFYQYTFHEKYKWLETIFYLAIGVCPSVVCLAMKEKSGIFELAFGGMLYISGVVFFKCDGLIPFAHAIWHCFVTTGAVCHYQAVCTYLLGPHNQIAKELTS